MSEPGRYCVAMTGSSGTIYGRRLVDALTELGHEVHVVLSEPAHRVLKHEDGLDVTEGWEALFRMPDRVVYHTSATVEATPASGAAGIRAVIVCPCSMGTLGRIANGYSMGLIGRAADVALKEGRPLVLVPRETPLSLIHLENMARLARAGAIVLPASPGFYQHPKSVDDMVDFVVAKILLRLGLQTDLLDAWRTPEPEWGAP